MSTLKTYEIKKENYRFSSFVFLCKVLIIYLVFYLRFNMYRRDNYTVIIH